jgi:hypothetical protein
VPSNSNNSLALATRNVYGHMYCDALTSNDGNTQNSAKTMDSSIAPVFQTEHLDMMHGERLLKTAVISGG